MRSETSLNAQRRGYAIFFVVGLGLIILMALVLLDAETTLLMLFLIGLIYPLGAAFILAVVYATYLTFYANDRYLTGLSAISVVYIFSWFNIYIGDFEQFRESDFVKVSFLYGFICLFGSFISSILFGKR